jgi:5-(carboxyamino)imidazole ribonucleotide mutase
MIELNLPNELDVLVVLGSISDKAQAEKMQPVFAEFGVRAHYAVCSAHRDHERLGKLIPAAEKAGCRVVVGVAGMAAHLPGVCAALTTLPVIGVPCTGALDGMDALLSVAQMPPNIPVACVAINGGNNAAILAVQICAAGRPELKEKLQEFRVKLREKNRRDNARLAEELNS